MGVALLTLAAGSQIPRITIDTDPENMLPADQGARLLHDRVKRNFTLYDMLVVGVVDVASPEGVLQRLVDEVRGGIGPMRPVVS